MRVWLWLMLYVGAVASGGCDQRNSRHFLGSDHFVSMQHEVGRATFAKASVCLDTDCGGRGDGRPDLETSEPSVMKELRLALLESQFDGPDLKWFGPAQAYSFAGDGHDMVVTVQYASHAPGTGKSLLVHVHGGRFSFDKYGFSQDSFQSPRLARLIRNRLLPPTAADDVGKTLQYLERGVLSEREWSREPPQKSLESGEGGR